MPEGWNDKGTKKSQVAAHFCWKLSIDYIFQPDLEAAIPILSLHFRIRLQLEHDAHSHYPIVQPRIALTDAW